MTKKISRIYFNSAYSSSIIIGIGLLCLFIWLLFNLNNFYPEKNILTQDTLISNQHKPFFVTIKNPKYSVKDIYGIWYTDLDKPQADFEIDSTGFKYFRHNSNVKNPYKIDNNKITFYFDSTTMTGLICKLQNDSLEIYWTSGEYLTYIRSTK